MSMENAKKLLKKLAEDAKLAKKFKKINAAAFEKAAKDSGYPCSAEDIRIAMEEQLKAGELSGEALGSITGGVVSGSAVCAMCNKSSGYCAGDPPGRQYCEGRKKG